VPPDEPPIPSRPPNSMLTNEPFARNPTRKRPSGRCTGIPSIALRNVVPRYALMMTPAPSETPCPSCGGPLAPGALGGGWFTWVPQFAPFRWTMFKQMSRPAKQFGHVRWPFWFAEAARCASCDIVVASTRRGRKGRKRMD
jgi:hypothetical protein